MKIEKLAKTWGLVVDGFLVGLNLFGHEVGKWVLATRLVLYLTEMFFVNAGRRHRRITDIEGPKNRAFFISLLIHPY